MADRIRLSRKKGWRLPPGTVKVDRTTIYGNPFIAGQPNGLGWDDVRDTDHAVWLYRHWLTTPSRSIAYELQRHDQVLRALPALAGKDLACWCTAGATCHADVLLELAARRDITRVTATLLNATGPRSALENTTVAAQLLRATGGEASDASRISSALTALSSATPSSEVPR